MSTQSLTEKYTDSMIQTLEELRGDVAIDERLYPVASTDIQDLDKIDQRLTDRIWRLNNLYTVIDEDGNRVKFQLREAQEFLLNHLHDKDIILKARQLGFTTFVCIFFLDFALFNSDKQLGIVAHTQDAATVIFRKVKVAWDNFNPALKKILQLEAKGDSKTEYEFTNGSIIRIATSLRSGTYQAILVSEFGKICARFDGKADEIITGTLPSANKGLIIIESTAEGENGAYYDMVQEAITLRNEGRKLTKKDYKFFFFAWYMNSANQTKGDNLPIDEPLLRYFQEIEEKTGIVLTQEQKNWYWLESKTQKDKMKQEHPSTPEEAFISSGNKLFNSDAIERQRQYHAKPYRVDGNFKYYKPYVKGHVYGLGADVSKGTKRDSSTIVVIDFTTGEVVMTFKSNEIDAVLFAYEIKKAAIEYGACVAAVENNSVGMTTCVALANIYDNVYTQFQEGVMDSSPTNKLGWNTNGLTKPKMMYELSESIHSEDLKILDRDIMVEASKFNKEDSLDTTIEKTDTTKHFDLLIGAAIAWQMRIYATRGRAPQEDIARVEEQRARTITRTRNSFR